MPNFMPTDKSSSKKEKRTAAQIPHNKPCLDQRDAQAAYDAVLSGWVAYGERGRHLEEKLSQSVFGVEKQAEQTNHAVLCSSGTAGIFLALEALDITEGDEVILPTYVCIALLNGIMMIGAKPVVVDIDIDNLSLTAEIVEKHVTARTKAIIAVHSYGIPCELDELVKLPVPIIEDCAQALGSKFEDGQPIGSKGALSVFSFYATKPLTGGYGGAVLAGDNKYLAAVRDYLDFDSPTEFKPRFNFMLSDINAAVVLSQLDKLSGFVERRKEIAQRFTEAIGNITYQIQPTGSSRFNHFRYLVQLSSELDLIDLKKHLAQRGIASIIPLENRELLHNYLGLDSSSFPVAEKASKTILSLPVYPCLTEEEVERIVAGLKEWNFA